MENLIIDPGHGGSDPGAHGFGSDEKDWVLDVSLYQYERLKELGAGVDITRTTDKTLDSGPRTNLIRDKYDYCMSNHFNAFNGEARGVEAIHSIFSSDKVASKIASAVVEASGLPMRRVFDKENSRGTDWYFIQRLTGSTKSIHIEYGFIDNKEDHEFYADKDNFYGVAEAVVKEWCGILGVAYKAPGKTYKPKKQVKSHIVEKPTGQVEKIQDTLNKRYSLNITVDDIPGPETNKALIKGYQTELNDQFGANLVIDGIWGPKTASASVVVAHGARGNLTWILQAALFCKNYHLSVDKIFGKNTEKVTRKFQADQGIGVDGKAGEVTFRYLFA